MFDQSSHDTSRSAVSPGAWYSSAARHRPVESSTCAAGEMSKSFIDPVKRETSRVSPVSVFTA